AAAARSGLRLAQRRITVNMTPAWRPKHGSGFDLAIALAVLDAQGDLLTHVPSDTVHLGELGLDGRLRPVPGVLPALLAARRAGISRVVVPAADADEAHLVEGLRITAAEDLVAVLRHHGTRSQLHEPPQHAAPPAPIGPARPAPAVRLDFRDVLGQAQARRATEVAAAGGHHLLLAGPPGAGKTMIAARIPGGLPPLQGKDALDVRAIHSPSGGFDARAGLITLPPFEAPHHAATTAAVVGGGSGLARPGAISRAHAGVLFLD